MSIYNDNSLISTLVLPLICGFAGLLLLGPFGFFLGAVLPLVIGAAMNSPESEKDERIAELEQKVEELEDRSDT